ncbi:hypothetical protein VNI00_019298 [Paramarasmius palmivorus]|uniref:Uncharacterized protein n=1 Tax=Paramarasmius palmivorus TaxID=297713 RepID=A0AAW0AP69_9AGAR
MNILAKKEDITHQNPPKRGLLAHRTVVVALPIVPHAVGSIEEEDPSRVTHPLVQLIPVHAPVHAPILNPIPTLDLIHAIVLVPIDILAPTDARVQQAPSQHLNPADKADLFHSKDEIDDGKATEIRPSDLDGGWTVNWAYNAYGGRQVKGASIDADDPNQGRRSYRNCIGSIQCDNPDCNEIIRPKSRLDARPEQTGAAFAHGTLLDDEDTESFYPPSHQLPPDAYFHDPMLPK